MAREAVAEIATVTDRPAQVPDTTSLAEAGARTTGNPALVTNGKVAAVAVVEEEEEEEEEEEAPGVAAENEKRSVSVYLYTDLVHCIHVLSFF